ncbi:MAG: hypothetical protein K2Q24_09190 [Chitinophagaceae bacterium]|nr:hypothetical protein [Chitinophagaceae bacterium]
MKKIFLFILISFLYLQNINAKSIPTPSTNFYGLFLKNHQGGILDLSSTPVNHLTKEDVNILIKNKQLCILEVPIYQTCQFSPMVISAFVQIYYECGTGNIYFINVIPNDQCYLDIVV